MSGKFIVLEGSDGSGTTSMRDEILKYLNKTGYFGKIIVTQEPSNSAIGLLLRKILKKEIIGKFSSRELTHLFLADRINHVNNVIRPALESGKHVICDRYYPSTLVYQSIKESLVDSITQMKNLYSEMFLCDGPWIIEPDLILFFNAEIDTLRRRRSLRGGKPEIFDDDKYQRMIVDLYQAWFSMNLGNKNMVEIKAEQDYETVKNECIATVQCYLDGNQLW